MREYKIEVNKEVAEYLERLSYEIASRTDIIAMLIENHKDDNDASVLESKSFKIYSTQLSELKAEFELAKQEFADTQIPSVFLGHQYDWSLDYKTNTLTIKMLCNCEVEI